MMSFEDKEWIASDCQMFLKLDKRTNIFMVLSQVIKKWYDLLTVDCSLDCLITCVHCMLTKPVKIFVKQEDPLTYIDFTLQNLAEIISLSVAFSNE